MRPTGTPSRVGPSTVAGIVAFWAAVAALLWGLDVLLFQRGVVWRSTPDFGSDLRAGSLALVYHATRAIELAVPNTAFVVGSSIVFNGVDANQVNSALARDDVPASLARLTTFGASTTDSALLAWHALDAHPWLIVYEGGPRDFQRTAATDSLIVRLFYDTSLELPALPPRDLEARLDGTVKRLWRLYRYRFFVRTLLDRALHDRLAPVLTAAGAFAAEPPPPVPPESLRYFVPGQVTAESWARWDHWRQTRSFEDYKLWLTGQSPGILKVYADLTLANYGPSDNPQVASLDAMVRATVASGTRMVVVYGPENPLFRTPEGAPYFDAALSDGYAQVFAEAAVRHGARFIDLRDLLEPDDFSDLVHLNLEGTRKASARMAEIVREEWAARGG